MQIFPMIIGDANSLIFGRFCGTSEDFCGGGCQSNCEPVPEPYVILTSTTW